MVKELILLWFVCSVAVMLLIDTLLKETKGTLELWEFLLFIILSPLILIMLCLLYIKERRAYIEKILKLKVINYEVKRTHIS